MIVTIINDCRDANAAGRQAARAGLLLSSSPVFIGVSNDLEAAGNIIDALDATEGREGVILANVAPRHGNVKRWKNGTPFGYFWYKKTLVLSTTDGLTLSLVKKLGLAQYISVLDISKTFQKLTELHNHLLELGQNVANSQFRSYDFLPRIAVSILNGTKVPSDKLAINEIPTAPHAIWWIDNFGNCKTTILPEEINHKANGSVEIKMGKFNFTPQLKDVPDGESALIIGSSGLEKKRFVEVVVQGDSAAKHYNLSVGDIVI